MAAHSGSGFDLIPPSPEQRKLLEADLTAEEANVLLRHATEAPFCGAFLDEKRPGVFTCRLCGLPLFLGGQKFESGTGWPSFTAPFDDDHLREERDSSYGMARTELLCARCGSPPGARVPRRPAAHGPALLHQLRVSGLYARGRAAARQARPWCPGGRALARGIGCVADCAPRHACLAARLT